MRTKFQFATAFIALCAEYGYVIDIDEDATVNIVSIDDANSIDSTAVPNYFQKVYEASKSTYDEVNFDDCA